MPIILLIEDEKILRENISELLEVYGFDCITAIHGKEGLEKAISKKPDLIICDIMLPYFNGYEIKEKLNKQADLALVPFIFLSAKIERSDLRLGMDLGAADFITKPFKISELVNSVKRRLAMSKHIQTTVYEKVIDSIQDFIHISKHECNTPLNGIINLSSILASEDANQSEFFHKAIKGINSSGKRLYKTLNNLIDLIRIGNIKNTNNLEHLSADIQLCIERILLERTEYYNYKGKTKIQLDCPETLAILCEDFEILIFEVMDNMFKFSSADCVYIDVSTRTVRHPDHMTVTVSNHIASPEMPSKNEIGPFKQYNSSQTTQNGSSLGLFLIKTIIEKYHGSLKIDRSVLDVFTINLFFPLT